MTTMRRILITGGTGHIAAKLAERLLQAEDVCVMLGLRAATPAEFDAKCTRLAAQLARRKGKIEFYPMDLSADTPFADINPLNIQVIIHAAAVTRFNVEEELAESVNIRGSEKVFAFAERCQKLERLALISTVYASGLQSGVIKEEPFDGAAGFANFYESSKWASENLLIKQYSHLPWQIHRVATIIANDESGNVEQYNAFHNTLKLLYYGLLPVIPGLPGTPLYFVTANFVVDAIVTGLAAAPAHYIGNVAHQAEYTLQLETLIKLAFEEFAQDSDFNKRRVMPPLFVEQESFDRLANSIQGFGGSVMRQSMSSISPFAQQLFRKKQVSNEKLLEILGERYCAPEPQEHIRRICRNLVSTKWGRDAVAAA